jgi:sulfite exporter TauE/SafE
MNENTEELKRTPCDYIHFGIIFAGFGLATVGVVINSIAGSLAGLFLLAVGLLYFLFRRSDLD